MKAVKYSALVVVLALTACNKKDEPAPAATGGEAKTEQAATQTPDVKVPDAKLTSVWNIESVKCEGETKNRDISKKYGLSTINIKSEGAGIESGAVVTFVGVEIPDAKATDYASRVDTDYKLTISPDSTSLEMLEQRDFVIDLVMDEEASSLVANAPDKVSQGSYKSSLDAEKGEFKLVLENGCKSNTKPLEYLFKKAQ